MNEQLKIFEKGSSWVRADFHLHTKADKKFVYVGKENSFISSYVDKLDEQNIKIAALTNHIKFDIDGYRTLL